MKIEVERQDLLSALAKCREAAIEKSPHVPYRACCIETDKKDQVKIYTTSELQAVEMVIPAEVKTPGKCVVSPKKLDEVINVISKGKILLEYSKKLAVKSKELKLNYSLATLDCEVIPIKVPEGTGWDMNATELLLAWNTIRSAVPDAGDGQKFPIARLLIDKTGFSLAAVDGHKCIKREFKREFGEAAEILVPCLRDKGAFNILKQLAADDEKVTVYHDDANVYWENTDTLVATRKIAEAYFPPVDEHVKSMMEDFDVASSVVMPADQLVDAMRAVSPVIDQFSCVQLTCEGGVLTISADSETGTCEEEIKVKNKGTFSLYLNANYTQEMLSPHKGKEIELSFIESRNAVVLKTETTTAFIMTTVKRNAA